MSMRMRRKRNFNERMLSCSDVLLARGAGGILNMKEAAERFRATIDFTQAFNNDRPVELEIGCGKGGFARGEAISHPDTAYIAVELITDVIVQAAERTPKEEYKNVVFLNTNASRLHRIFPAGSFERIHINFCDPWPKKRNAKRRLTCRTFLSLFRPLLSEGGCIAFKTDNADLFEYSLPEFEAAGYRTEKVTRDLHASEYYGCDTETEYEKAFSEKGTPICRLEAYPIR